LDDSAIVALFYGFLTYVAKILSFFFLGGLADEFSKSCDNTTSSQSRPILHRSNDHLIVTQKVSKMSKDRLTLQRYT